MRFGSAARDAHPNSLFASVALERLPSRPLNRRPGGLAILLLAALVPVRRGYLHPTNRGALRCYQSVRWF